MNRPQRGPLSSLLGLSPSESALTGLSDLLDTLFLFMKLKENKSNCFFDKILIKTRKSYNYTQFFFYYTGGNPARR